ncbi:MAG: heat-shock protein [Rhodanobacteraceae bacterium]
MSTLSRFNPFKAITRLDPSANFDDLFRSMGMRPWRDSDGMPDLRIDVAEDDKAYSVKAEIPGVDKKDIDVSVDGNQVSISAEVKREKERKDGEKEIYTERYYGKVFRSFTLPGDVDAAKASAQYDSGVLTLTLPKQPNGNARKISIG